MGFEQLPGYDDWKTAGPRDTSADYEAGLEHHAADVSDFCEKAVDSCRWAGFTEDGDFTGCSQGITDAAFRVQGNGQECPEVQAAAEGFSLADRYADEGPEPWED